MEAASGRIHLTRQETAGALQVYVCRSGSAADTQAIADIVRMYLNMHSLESGKAPEIPVAANILNQMCYGNKNNLMAGMICAGWDERNGGVVYSIPLGGGLFREDYTIGGSGSGYIYGYCDANFKKGMSKQEAQVGGTLGTCSQCRLSTNFCPCCHESLLLNSRDT